MHHQAALLEHVDDPGIDDFTPHSAIAGVLAELVGAADKNVLEVEAW